MIPFEFYWDRLNIWAGIKFLIVVFFLVIIAKWIEFPWFVVGMSVVLAWLVVLLGNPKNKILMVFLYLLVGLGFTLISNYFSDTYWPWLIFMFFVTFISTYLLKYGMHWYMLGWCLILWFLNMPVLLHAANTQELVISHLIGSSAVLLLVFLSGIWKRFVKKVPDEVLEETQKAEPMAEWWILTYSTIVGLVVVIGLMLGHKYTSDPTMIPTAAFMIIVFTGTAIIWKAGIERLIGAILAIVIGFYLGAAVQSEVLGMVIMIISAFTLFAMIVVNNGAVIFFFVLILSYGWGLKDFDTGNALANERILAEFAGVFLAAIAITSMNLISKYMKPSEV